VNHAYRPLRTSSTEPLATLPLRLSQELLTTFNGTLAEVALQPNHVEGGVFTVRLDMGAGAGEELVWSRAEEGRFPESAELKRKVRDILAPEKHLGHSEDKYGVVDDRPPSARSAVSRLLALFSAEKRVPR